MTTPDRFDKVYQFLRVWRNECIRVFVDRLINDTDRAIVHVRTSKTPNGQLLTIMMLVFVFLCLIFVFLIILFLFILSCGLFCLIQIMID